MFLAEAHIENKKNVVVFTVEIFVRQELKNATFECLELFIACAYCNDWTHTLNSSECLLCNL